MLDLYLFRHAESESNKNPHLIGGRSDETPLSPLGELQASWLGERLRDKGVDFDQIYSSTAARAKKTAAVVCKQIGYPLENIIYSERLLELDQGEWQGQPRTKIYTLQTLARIDKDNWNFTPPKGESQRQVEERIYSWIEESLLANYGRAEQTTVGAFTHGMAIKCVLRKILSSAPAMTHKIELENTSITRLKYDEKGWHLSRLNDASHLEF